MGSADAAMMQHAAAAAATTSDDNYVTCKIETMHGVSIIQMKHLTDIHVERFLSVTRIVACFAYYVADLTTYSGSKFYAPHLSASSVKQHYLGACWIASRT